MAGCSPSTGQIAGKLTRDGNLVPGATVELESTTAADDRYFGVTDDQGEIRITYRGKTGAPPGNYRVKFTVQAMKDGKPVPKGEEGAVARSNGEVIDQVLVFEREIVAGANNFAFDLKDGKKIDTSPPAE